MSVIFLFVFLVAIPHTAVCTTTTSNGLQERLIALYGEGTNLTRDESIIREEAATLGLTSAYFAACSENVMILLPSEYELAELNEEMDSLDFHQHATIHSKDEILPLLESRAPKLHAAIALRLAIIGNHLAQLDPCAQSFMRNVGEAILDGIFSYTKTRNTLVSFADMTFTTKKISEMHQSLPLSSKKDIETAFCFNTSNRILTEENKIQRFLAELALP